MYFSQNENYSVELIILKINFGRERERKRGTYLRKCSESVPERIRPKNPQILVRETNTETSA